MQRCTRPHIQWTWPPLRARGKSSPRTFFFTRQEHYASVIRIRKYFDDLVYRTRVHQNETKVIWRLIRYAMAPLMECYVTPCWLWRESRNFKFSMEPSFRFNAPLSICCIIIFECALFFDQLKGGCGSITPLNLVNSLNKWVWWRKFPLSKIVDSPW